MTLKIRELTEQDLYSFRTLRLRALREEPQAFGTELDTRDPDGGGQQQDDLLRRACESPKAYILGGWIQDSGKPRLAGCLGFQRMGRLAARHKAVIWGMYVVPEARGQGLGSALLQEALLRAGRQRGLRKITLNVVPENLAALKIYSDAGFERFGHERDAFCVRDHYYDVLMLSLDLRARR